MDFERKSGQVSGTTVYYYPRESVTGCYYSIVNQDKVQEGTMEDVLKDLYSYSFIYSTFRIVYRLIRNYITVNKIIKK